MEGRRVRVLILALLYAECSAKFLQFNQFNDTVYLGYGGPKAANTGHPPPYYDWREKNMVTPVKNQLNCAACWAFTAVAAIESHYKIYNKKDFTLSEQFLIDCDEGNNGCGGANMLKTYAHIVSVFGGVLKEADYFPYENGKKPCRWTKIPRPVPVIGFKRVKRNEDEMVRYVYHYGPLSAAINSASMAKYTHGIDEPTNKACPPEEPDHTVLIVGYNEYVSKDGKVRVPYWIIKNSWGKEWGEEGFYYLVRGRNACGISGDVTLPFVK